MTENELREFCEKNEGILRVTLTRTIKPQDWGLAWSGGRYGLAIGNKIIWNLDEISSLTVEGD